MKRYAEYKDSCIPWLGKIPTHWGELKLSQVATEHFLSNKNVHHQNLLSLSYGKIVRRDINATEGLLPASFDTYQIVKPGNIVLRLTDLQNDQRSLRVGLAKEEGIVTSAYLALQVRKNTFPDYLYLFLHTTDIHKYFYSLGSGIRQNLNFSGLRDILIAIPPIDEQKAIVEYLDSKTSKIDSYVAERERELRSLEELKQAEIADIVTHGLNPDVPMRDSGIPWLGKIPAHWKLKQLRSYLKLISEKGHGDKQLLSVTREQGVIIRNVESKEENHNYIPEDLSNYKLVKIGQFVVNKMKSWQGSYAVSEYEGIVSPAYYVCELNFPCKEFFSLAIRSKAYVPFFSQLSKGIRVDQWDLSPIALKSIYFAEPPLHEQRSIVDYINAKTAKIDGLIADLTAEIEKLKEYKQRLIADVVTGQIDVRK